jgi:predicted deacylase
MIRGRPSPRVERSEVRAGGTRLHQWRVSAPEPGPRVVVTANLHGDEVTGLAAAFELLDSLPGTLLRGSVLLLPSLNPEGLVARTRTLPGDSLDPNRAFPGDPTGSPAERRAATIWAAIQAWAPDALLDLHADSANALPYALLDRGIALQGAEREGLEARSLALARGSGLVVVRDLPDEAYRRAGFARSLSGAALNVLGIPSLTLELGPRRTLDGNAAGSMSDAVRGALGALGMIALAARTPPLGGVWQRVNGPAAPRTGLLVPEIAPGVACGAGRRIGSVRGLEGEPGVPVLAPRDGVVLAWAEHPWVTERSAVCTWASEKGP